MKIVYGSDGCVLCETLVEKLKESGTKFKYVDIKDVSNDELVRISKESGQMTLPIVINNGE